MFKAVPEIFYQLCIIHTIHAYQIILVIYVPLRGKSADTCMRLIEEILGVTPYFLAVISNNFMHCVSTRSFEHVIAKLLRE